MKKRTRDLESLRTMVRSDGKKFVRLDEGAALYSIGLNTFRDIVRDAGAIYRVKPDRAGEHRTDRRILGNIP